MIIRKAQKKDSKELIRLIEELADFEKLSPPDMPAQKRLLAAAFSKQPKINILVAEEKGKLIAYAIYMYLFSSFLAKPTLYLEDIYVSNNFRRSGTGKKIFDKLISIAKTKKCGRLELMVLNWNKNAIRFYEKYSARQLKEWKFYRMEF